MPARHPMPWPRRTLTRVGPRGSCLHPRPRLRRRRPRMRPGRGVPWRRGQSRSAVLRALLRAPPLHRPPPRAWCHPREAEGGEEWSRGCAASRRCCCWALVPPQLEVQPRSLTQGTRRPLRCLSQVAPLLRWGRLGRVLEEAQRGRRTRGAPGRVWRSAPPRLMPPRRALRGGTQGRGRGRTRGCLRHPSLPRVPRGASEPTTRPVPGRTCAMKTRPSRACSRLARRQARPRLPSTPLPALLLRHPRPPCAPRTAGRRSAARIPSAPACR
mmetsp:Transcript_22425/g.60646  ORF Transcript_22425/g.60646 Transcript_22425/m.60646 type:complete len:270 (-) Transcript_22425:3114-3923(-)